LFSLQGYNSLIFNRKINSLGLVSPKALEVLNKEKSTWKGISIEYTGRVGN